MKRSEFHSENAHYLVLENEAGLRLTLCDFGASLYEVLFQGVPMTIAPRDHGVFEKTTAFYGKTIGRIAGRVKNGCIEIAGKKCQMSLTEGKNTLHGGKASFAFQHFEEKVEETPEKTIVTYTYRSPDGEEDMPGNLLFQTIYEIPEKEASFTLRFLGVADKDSLLCPILHPYFNLGEEDIMGHSLTLFASSYYEMDGEMIPLKAVPCTPLLDFSKGKKIGPGADDPSFLGHAPWGYDHIYVLDQNAPAAILASEDFQVEVETDCPCLLIYADNFAKGEKLTNGLLEKKHAALTIECCEHPAAAKPIILKSGETYSRYSTYHFQRRKA